MVSFFTFTDPDGCIVIAILQVRKLRLGGSGCTGRLTGLPEVIHPQNVRTRIQTAPSKPMALTQAQDMHKKSLKMLRTAAGLLGILMAPQNGPITRWWEEGQWLWGL